MNIIKHVSGKIDTPGIYDLDIDLYHSDICSGPSISSSGLRTIQRKSLLHYWAFSYLNPDRIEEEAKDCYTFGQAAHHLLLGEKNFREKFTIRPEEIGGKAWQGNRTECKAWVAEQKLPILTMDDLAQIRGMAKSLASHPLIMAGLLNGEPERSLIWKDAETGIWLKSRPDTLPTHADLIVDLKTTADASAHAVRRTIFDFGYEMQMALVGMGMQAVMDRTPGPEDFVLVFIEKRPPFAINVKVLDQSAITWGTKQIRAALRKFADCWEKKEFPGYSDDGTTATLPRYAEESLKIAVSHGELEA